MKFNLTYGPDIASAPAGFKATVEAVAAFFESTFTDPVTINVKVERGLTGGLLGHSEYTLTGPYTYAQITSALAKDSQTGSDAIALAALPAADPIPDPHAYYMTPAQAKALALLGPSDALDGTVQFADNPPFDYDRSDGITPGFYDFYGSVAHEFSEVMGRELNAIGNEVQTGAPNGYYPFDLFKYSAAGVRTFVGTTDGYFSPDGGVTNLNNFNTDSDDDFGDWAASAGNDSFLAFSSSGVLNAVTATDIVAMDVIGWNAAPGSGGLVALLGHGGGGVRRRCRGRRAAARAGHPAPVDIEWDWRAPRNRSLVYRDRPRRGHRPLHGPDRHSRFWRNRLARLTPAPTSRLARAHVTAR
jgi:hypothetical protein